MAALTFEEKVALFGEDVARAMQETESAQKGSGVSIPYSILKNISDMGNESGQFGEFVYGVKKEKQPDGQYKVVDVGTNIGKEFNFIPVSIAYRYRRWDAKANKNYVSSIFMNASDGDMATDSNGNRLPAGKEAKKEAGWKMVKMVAGLVNKKDKEPWVPVLWEISGKMFFTYNNVANKLPNPVIGGIVKIKTKFEKQGSTTYTVIDETGSSIGTLPADFLTNNRQIIGEMTIKMKEFFTAYSAKPKSKSAAPVVEADDDEADSW
mgnify:CR=1 FL=1